MRIIGIVTAAAAAATSASASTESDSLLRVLMPPALSGSYNHSEALFGINSYGTGLTGNLALVTESGCSPLNGATWPPRAVALIDRGGCSFVTKVRNVQQAGGVAAVVVNDHMVCDGCPLPFMADDGTGGDVSIPSYLIAMQDGLRLRQCLAGVSPGCSGHSVQVEMRWNMPHPDGRVEFDLWTSSLDPQAVRFKSSFAPLALSLGSHVLFTPHYFIYDGVEYGCTIDAAICGSQCTNGGRYCWADPDGSIGSGLEGRDLVRENLRQLCIWRTANGRSDVWWKYVAAFNDRCTNAGSAAEFEACSQNVQRFVGLNPSDVNACVAASGGSADNSGINTILASEIQLRSDMNILRLPTGIVNNMIMRGSLTASSAFSTICNGFLTGTTPAACGCAGKSGDDLTSCVAGAKDPTDQPSTSWISTRTFWGAIAVLTIAIAGAFFGWNAYQRHRVRQQVRHVLAEYMPLEEASSLGVSSTATGATRSAPTATASI